MNDVSRCSIGLAVLRISVQAPPPPAALRAHLNGSAGAFGVVEGVDELLVVQDVAFRLTQQLQYLVLRGSQTRWRTAAASICVRSAPTQHNNSYAQTLLAWS